MLDQSPNSTLSATAKDASLIFGQNPVDGSRIEPGYVQASAMDVTAAVTRAHDAFVAGPSSAEDRVKLLTFAAEEIEALGQALIDLGQAETALPEGRLKGERQRTVDQLHMFARVVAEGAWLDVRIETALPDRAPAPRPDLRSFLMPVGPIAVFGASNFPFAFSTAGGDTASALAAGCPVIFKAHPAHPGTSELVAGALGRAVQRAGLPSGTFSHLHGRHEVGERLVTHPLIQSVAFTGSMRGGMALWKLATTRPEPIPVFAEMGSINPIFLLPDALASRGESVAREFAAALVLGVGQFCTNPGIAVGLAGPELDAWRTRFAEEAAKTAGQPMLTEEMATAYGEAGARLARITAAHVTSSAEAAYVTPGIYAVSANEFLANAQLHEEVFGPTCIVVECASISEMLAVAGSIRGQLTATIQSDPGDAELELQITRLLRHKVGRLIRNGYPTGVEVCESMHHGGPFPSTTDSRFTSVGSRAILRFARPICYQNATQEQLPPELRDENPLGIVRRINGVETKAPLNAI